MNNKTITLQLFIKTLRPKLETWNPEASMGILVGI